jgi:LacI family transcriptional regulator
MNHSKGLKKKRPTLADVAQKAGVGVMTVSRVINKHPSVSPAMRKKILAAIEEVDYMPNEAARLLKGGRSRTIGLIVPDLSDGFFAACAHKVQEVARSHGFLTLVVSSEREQRLELKEAELMASHHVAGVVVVPSGQDDRPLIDIFGESTPIIAMDRPLSRVQADAVVAENRGGAEEAVRHLLGHGHKHIVCIGYDRDVYTVRERVAAYQSTMRAAGLTPCVYDDISILEQVQQLLGRLLKGTDRPTAIFSLNHRTSVQVLQTLQNTRFSIPKDLALVGFDDVDLASVLTLPLTTVSQSAADLGFRAATLLFERIESQSGPIFDGAKIVLPTRLIVRGSCGCGF